MKIYGVTGWKNAGKTGLMERLVACFCARGLRISTIKHAHQASDLDSPGRDSHRHREAGAHQVVLATPHRWALMEELRGAPEPDLDALLAQLAPVDLVLIEGYKAGPHPKIEAFRAANGKAPLAIQNASIRAIAADAPPGHSALPIFDLDDTEAIANFIANELDL